MSQNQNDLPNTSVAFEPDEIQRDFLEEVRFMLESIEESFLKLENPENRRDELTNIFRVIHSVKGAAAAVGFEDLGKFAHGVEDLLQILRVEAALVTAEIVTLLLKALDLIKARIHELAQGRRGPWDVTETAELVKAQTVSATAQLALLQEQHAKLTAAPVSLEPSEAPKTQSINSSNANDDVGRLLKVDANRVSSVIELVGELVTIKGQIMRDVGLQGSPSLRTAVDLLDKAVRELQDQALGMRMTSLKSTFQKVQRIARDLSVKLSKPVVLTIAGEDTEMDRNLTESLTDPLVHLIRNAIDHGIEAADVRASRGKQAMGSLSVTARQKSGRIVIEIKDDGGGINRVRVLEKARANGLIAPERSDSDIPDREAFAFLFAAGFSTAEKVTDVSGRGVGLDVVKTNIQKLKGNIEIESEPQKGTTFRLSLPLTTSIAEGILVEAGGRNYILPIDRMREILQLRDVHFFSLSPNAKAIRVREETISYLSLKSVLVPGADQVQHKNEAILVMEGSDQLVAIAVDRVLSQTQVVLKPLDQRFQDQIELSGATILGDGTVALVLDVDGLLATHGQTLEQKKAS